MLSIRGRSVVGASIGRLLVRLVFVPVGAVGAISSPSVSQPLLGRTWSQRSSLWRARAIRVESARLPESDRSVLRSLRIARERMRHIIKVVRTRWLISPAAEPSVQLSRSTTGRVRRRVPIRWSRRSPV